jgi:hypothetical protein
MSTESRIAEIEAKISSAQAELAALKAGKNDARAAPLVATMLDRPLITFPQPPAIALPTADQCRQLIEAVWRKHPPCCGRAIRCDGTMTRSGNFTPAFSPPYASFRWSVAPDRRIPPGICLSGQIGAEIGRKLSITIPLEISAPPSSLPPSRWVLRISWGIVRAAICRLLA